MLTKHTITHFELWDSDFDDLCLFTSQLNLAVSQFELLKLSVPRWLSESLDESKRVLTERTRVQKLTELKRLKANRETLLTTDEKRANIETLIVELESALK